ncbi:hypothetical protein H4J51_00325 [Colwellia sp. MB02u-18]|jgi:hypothetical protein|uniref:hypothetical protein n=1 Tax=unclassified Colwellia TaxID=196834 RepID=UPI0015F476F2|nr:MULTISPECIES: hypothetical protein [unclassified Colwellia]MBA6223187.1 hypothetical protein [Colwellia sp. MB3u-45]MBA6265953.1 hypothetical protein [Colwellia sp. MB3u-43]MBA6320262.1 hypothetical protein [Colwellia sp. MB02u-19]MBA6323021.1 hypothetical protein [Colwellia sp. MB02u-18]MBA6330354.1 hypothetical protein [Colwellia sp. MB02u-12]
MLIINGTAELMKDNGSFQKGDRHEFNMFSVNMPLEDQLIQIEDYLVTRGWDNIEVTNNGIVEDLNDIEHAVLKAAYEKAKNEGFAVTVNNQALI